MKLQLWFLTLVLFGAQRGASAAPRAVNFEGYYQYEDEAFSREVEAGLALGSGPDTVWSADARLQGPLGDKVTLFTHAETTPVRPANTMSIFTAWLHAHFLPDLFTDDYKIETLARMVQQNDDHSAEVLFREARRAAGEERDAFFSGFDGLVQADAGGLSYQNRASAHSLVSALAVLRQEHPRFREFLAVAGKSGNLAERKGLANCGGSVQAVLGRLNNNPATSLAGYVVLSNGWEMTFALLGDRVRDVKTGEDAIDAALCRTIQEAHRMFANMRAQ